MKNTWIPALALVLGIGGLGFAAQDEGPDDTPEEGVARTQLDILKDDLASTRLELEKMKTGLVELRAEHEQLVSWAAAQAKAASAMESTLSASEQAGFTAGINPRSRELLLEGWRAHMDAAQKGVPKQKKSKGDTARR